MLKEHNLKIITTPVVFLEMLKWKYQIKEAWDKGKRGQNILSWREVTKMSGVTKMRVINKTQLATFPD